jgi:hypothetical protein
VFCAEIGVKGEPHFQLIDRLCSDVGCKNLVKALECVVIPFEASDTFLHGKPRLCRVLKTTNSG